MTKYAPVMLRCEIEINGRMIRAQQAHSQSNWSEARHDQRYMDAIRAQLRTALGVAIVQALDPEVTVHLPSQLEEAAMESAMDELPDA